MKVGIPLIVGLVLIGFHPAARADDVPACRASVADALAMLKGKGVAVETEEQLRALKKVAIAGKVTDADLPLLCPLTWLTELALPNDGSKQPLTGKSLEYLGHLTRLETLDLDGNRLTAASLVKLAPLTELRELKLMNNRFAGEGLAALGAHKKLAILDVQGSHLDDKAVADLSKLGNHPTLAILGVNDNLLGEKGLAALKSLGKLAALKASSIALQTGESLEQVATMPGLKSLDIGNWDFTSFSTPPDYPNAIEEKNLALLAAAKQLEILHLPKLDLTDKSLEYIARIKTLRGVNLIGNARLTANGLLALEALDDLRCIGTIDPSWEKSDAVARLRKKFPKLVLTARVMPNFCAP